MSCTNVGGPVLPDCQNPKVLICVRNSTDPFPIQAWAVATCVANAVTAINLFSDEAGTVPLVGYTLGDRVPCTEEMEQITSPIVAQVLSSQLAMQATQESVGEEIEQALAPLSRETTQVAVRTLLESLQTLVLQEDQPAVSGAAGIAMFGMRQLIDSASTDNDGDLSMFKMDEEGRAKVSTKPASFVPVSGVANAVNSAVAVDVSRASNVTFHVKNTGAVTIAAGTFAFEGSIDSTDGVDGTWFSVQAVPSNSNLLATTVALSAIAVNAGAVNAFEASVNGYKWFRVRNTVAVTATANAFWTIQRGSYATEPIPAAQVSGTQPVSGTVTATVTGATVTPIVPTPYTLNSAAGLNLTSVRTGTTGLHALHATNGGVGPAFLKLYNKATAPVVATDVPVMILTIPAVSGGLPGQIMLPVGFMGFRFPLGLAMAITGAFPDTDSTAILAGQVKVAMAVAA